MSQQKLLDIILEEKEVGWKEIIYDLVKTEQMDPWDINLTKLTQKYLSAIKKMQEHDLRVSGKVLLAAAVLLKIKSNHLVDNDLSKLDALINQTEEDIEEESYEEFGEDGLPRRKLKQGQYTLIPRNPQARNRKVSIHDLVNALQRAMNSKRKVLARMKPVKFTMPDRKIDIMEVIRDIYHKITYYTRKENKKKIKFSRLLPPRAGKQEKVFTFLPLLHLENQAKINMEQKQPFSEINVSLTKKKK